MKYASCPSPRSRSQPASPGRGGAALAGVAASVVLLALAACGGGGGSDSAAGSGPEATARTAAAPPAPVRVFSGPIVITQGGVYSGAWESTDPTVYAVRIHTAEPVTIINSEIRSKNTGIWSLGWGANVVVRNTVGVAVNPNVAGQTKGCFIDIGNFSSVVLENNHIEGWQCGIRALNYGGPADLGRVGQVVKVRFNRFRDIDGRRSDGQGGYQPVQAPSGQAIGMNTVRKADAVIAWNEIINRPYHSMVEDIISTYESGGTAGNPILIQNNYVAGGYHANPALALDYSGAGINLGDCPNAGPDCAYVEASGNVVVSFSNSGMGIAGGHHMRMFDNRVVSAQRAPGGTVIGSTWRTGFGFWNYYDSPYWAENRMFGNYSLTINRDGLVADNYTPSATPESVYGNVVDGTPNTPPTFKVSSEHEKAEHRRWQRRASAAGVVVGPSTAAPAAKLGTD
jgi:hypothetical protein